MGKWIHPDILGPVETAMADAFDDIGLSDGLVVCTTQPDNYFEAVNPEAWAAGTAYDLDDTARPAVDRNGFTYRCTTAGTSGASEPVWPTTAGETVNDGTAVWTAYACNAVGNAAMTGADFVVVDMLLTIMPKTGITVHSGGEFAHIALIRSGTAELALVSTCEAQTVTAGNIVNTAAFTVSLTGP